MIDYIIGFIFLPFSILLFTNLFGWTQVDSIIGIPLMTIAAVGLIIVQISNILAAHINKQFIKVSWALCLVMMWPSVIYFLSAFMSFPDALIVALPPIIGSFIFVEGVYSFYIDNEKSDEPAKTGARIK